MNFRNLLLEEKKRTKIVKKISVDKLKNIVVYNQPKAKLKTYIHAFPPLIAPLTVLNFLAETIVMRK